MASKVIEIAGIGPVTLTKRAASRSLRLSVSSGKVRVSMPRWTPFSAGQTFVLSHIVWIKAELSKQAHPILTSGQAIGKLHHLRFERVTDIQSVASRVTGTEVIVKLRNDEISDMEVVQIRARTAATRACKREAETLLPPRLKSLAEKHGKSYHSVSVKQLKRRWGSCDSQKNIVLNLYLMELPWDQIDYVLLHELAHTVAMSHGEDFWQALIAMQPRARDLARVVRRHQPTIGLQT